MADENGEQPAELPKRPSSPDSFLRESDIPTPPPPKIIPISFSFLALAGQGYTLEVAGNGGWTSCSITPPTDSLLH